MDEPGQSPVVDIVASPVLRISVVLGLAAGVLYLVIGIIQVWTEGFGSLISFVTSAWVLGYFGWMGYGVVRHPVLHLDSTEIRWRPIGSVGALRMPVAEVTGFRWPYPLDLWLEGARGASLRINMVGIRRRDRERARAWLSGRWADGGLIER